MRTLLSITVAALFITACAGSEDEGDPGRRADSPERAKVTAYALAAGKCETEIDHNNLPTSSGGYVSIAGPGDARGYVNEDATSEHLIKELLIEKVGRLFRLVQPNGYVRVGEVSAGIFLWLPKWLPADYPLSPRQIADEVCDVIAYGLATR